MKGSYEPKSDNLYALANYFGVTPSWLLGYTDDPTENDCANISEKETEGKTNFSSSLNLLFHKTNVYNRLKPEQILKIPKDYLECYPNDVQLAFGKWYVSSLRSEDIFILTITEKENIRQFLRYMSCYKSVSIDEIAAAAGLKKDFLIRLKSPDEDDIHFCEISTLAHYFGITMNCVIGNVLNRYIAPAVAEKIGDSDDKELCCSKIIDFDYVREIAEKLGVEKCDLVHFRQFELFNSTAEKDENENELVHKSRLLNSEGERRLNEYLDDLLLIEKYAENF
jgi:transcriptional regulator with XRE-family HTH domain